MMINDPHQNISKPFHLGLRIGYGLKVMNYVILGPGELFGILQIQPTALAGRILYLTHLSTGPMGSMGEAAQVPSIIYDTIRDLRQALGSLRTPFVTMCT